MDAWWEDQWDKSKLKIRIWYKKDWKHYKYRSNINMWLQTGYQQEKEKRTRTWARTLLGWAVATGAVAWLQCGHSKNFMTLGKCLSQRITKLDQIGNVWDDFTNGMEWGAKFWDNRMCTWACGHPTQQRPRKSLTDSIFWWNHTHSQLYCLLVKNMNLGNLEAGLQWYLVDAGTNASPSQHPQYPMMGHFPNTYKKRSLEALQLSIWLDSWPCEPPDSRWHKIWASSCVRLHLAWSKQIAMATCFSLQK